MYFIFYFFIFFISFQFYFIIIHVVNFLIFNKVTIPSLKKFLMVNEALHNNIIPIVATVITQ